MTTTTSPDLCVGPHERAEHLGVPYCARCGPDQVWPCPWTSTLRALTLHQPWTTFVVAGPKTIETRSWKTSYRGWIALHAGSTVPPYLGLGRRGRREIGDYEVEKDQSGLLLRKVADPNWWPYRLPLGAIVAAAELVDCIPMTTHADLGDPECLVVHGDGTVDHAIPATPPPPGPANVVRLDEPDVPEGIHLIRDITAQEPYGDFAPGRWAWMLGRVIRLPRAIPCAGHQGLWDLRRAGPEVVDTVEDLIARRAA